MKAILAIARVEVLRNWRLIAVPLSAVLGVLVLALTGTQQSDRTFSGSLMGMLILFELPLAGVPAVVLGLNLFAPDIRQGKLSFFLTRPCGPWQLYLGRLLGAALITSVGWLGAGVLLPFMGVTGSLSGGGMLKSTDAIIAALVLAGLLVFMNSVALILASNAPGWLLADVAMGLALSAAAVWSAKEALRLGDPSLVLYEFTALVPVGVVALFFAGLTYMSIGRGDGPRGHRAHSLTLWSFGIASLLGLAAHRGYEWSRSLGSVFPPGIAQAVGPDQALIMTFQRWGRPIFLLDTRTGEARRISGFVDFASKADLKSGLVARLEERLNPPRKPMVEEHLVISSLSGAPPLVDRRLHEDFRRILHISEGGRRVLLSTPNGFDVIDAQTGVTALRFAASRLAMAVFQADGNIAALMEEGRSTIRLAIVAPDGSAVTDTRFPIVSPEWAAMIHSDSGRVALTEPESGVTVFGRDGTSIARLAPEPPEISDSFRGKGYLSREAVFFSRTGDLIVAGARGLRVLRHDEAVVREIPLVSEGVILPAAAGRRITGELDSGDIGIFQSARGVRSTMLVDPSTGAVRLNVLGVRPLTRRSRVEVRGASSPSEDSGLRLFQNEDGDIVFLDPGSTQVRLLVESTKEDR